MAVAIGVKARAATASSLSGRYTLKVEPWITLSIAVHMVLVGVPIALFTRRAHGQ